MCFGGLKLCEDVLAYRILLFGAFFMGFSMPIGRVSLLLSLAFIIVGVFRRRCSFFMPRSGWLWLALVVLAVTVTAFGIDPPLGLKKIDKLFWYIGIPVAATIVDTRAKLKSVLMSLVSGISVLGVLTILCNIHAAVAIVERFHNSRMAKAFKFGQELIMQGSLIDGERLMIGAIIAMALFAIASPCARYRLKMCLTVFDGAGAKLSPQFPKWLSKSINSGVPILATLLFVILVAEGVVLKRGSWVCTIVIAFLLFARKIKKVWLALCVTVLVAAAFLIVPVRNRITAIPNEFDCSKGGRATMWVEIAPKLLSEHPFGIGFRSLTPERMQAIAPHCEKNRNHLHSNLVEMAVSLGWEGLAMYLVWISFMLYDAMNGGSETKPVFWAILAIFINGFVEYNFADAEIIVILGLLGGLAAAGRKIHKIELFDLTQQSLGKNE